MMIKMESRLFCMKINLNIVYNCFELFGLSVNCFIKLCKNNFKNYFFKKL